MRWHHGHSWAAGIVTGILIDQHAFMLVMAGGIAGFLFTKIGSAFTSLRRGLSRRWAIRP